MRIRCVCRFRVNHEPLARLPSATAPLQLVVGNATPLPLAIAAAPPTALGMIDAPVRNNGAGGAAAPQAPAVVPEPQTAAAAPEPVAPQATQPQTAAAEPESPASEAPERRLVEAEPPAPPPAASTEPATNEHIAEAPAREADPAPAGGASPPKPLSPQDQPQQATLPDEEHEAKLTAGLDTFAEVGAVADTAAAQALPVEKTKREREAARTAAGQARSVPAAKAAQRVEEKKRTRVAVRIRRIRRPRVAAVAAVDGQVGAAPQFATAPQQQFQTVPLPENGVRRPRSCAASTHVPAAGAQTRRRGWSLRQAAATVRRAHRRPRPTCAKAGVSPRNAGGSDSPPARETPLSVLDLSPVTTATPGAAALRNRSTWRGSPIGSAIRATGLRAP